MERAPCVIRGLGAECQKCSITNWCYALMEDHAAKHMYMTTHGFYRTPTEVFTVECDIGKRKTELRTAGRHMLRPPSKLTPKFTVQIWQEEKLHSRRKTMLPRWCSGRTWTASQQAKSSPRRMVGNKENSEISDTVSMNSSTHSSQNRQFERRIMCTDTFICYTMSRYKGAIWRLAVIDTWHQRWLCSTHFLDSCNSEWTTWVGA